MPTQVQLSAPDWLRPFGQGAEDLSGPERRDVRRRIHTETPVVSEMPLSPGSLMAIAGMMPALFGGAKYLPQAGAVVRRIPETLRNAMRTGDSVAVAKRPVGRIGAAKKTRREALQALFPLPKIADIGKAAVELGGYTPAEVDAYAAAKKKDLEQGGDSSGSMSEHRRVLRDIESAQEDRQWEGPRASNAVQREKKQDVQRRINQYPVGRSGLITNTGGNLPAELRPANTFRPGSPHHRPGDLVPTSHRPNTITAHLQTGAQLIGEEVIQALAAEASEKLGRYVSEEEIRQQIDEASGIEGTYDKAKAALARRFGR
jgi:hypothetical protein